MSLERAKAYLGAVGMGERVLELEQSSATVELAALALGCEPCRIAKTLSFLQGETPVLLVTAGDAKVDNQKYRQTFQTKARMIPGPEVEAYTGHHPGGVCPFGVKDGVMVYLDRSLQRFETVFPAAGSGNSAIELTLGELEQTSRSQGWVDVCKGWSGAAQSDG